MGLRYDGDAARARAAEWTEAMRDAAYRAGVVLAREKGAFPLFDAAKLLSGHGRSGCPRTSAPRSARGLRNSHLLDRPDRHHQPRLRRQRLERHRAGLLLDLHPPQARAGRVDARVPVEDHAWRLWRRAAATTRCRPPS